MQDDAGIAANLRLMRKVALIATALTLVLSGAASGAERPSTTRYEVTELEAEFFVEPRRGEGVMYIGLYGLVKEDLDTGEVIERAGAGIGRCAERADGCGIEVKPYRIVRFDVNEQMMSAHLVIRRGAVRHELTFETALPRFIVPPLYQNPNLCDGTTTTLVVDGRNAFARGKAFGYKVRTGRDADPDLDTAEMMERRLEIQDCA